MAKPTRYIAKFSNGTEATRSSHRPYTHAWRVTYQRHAELLAQRPTIEPVNTLTGFSTSEAGADRNMRKEFAHFTHFTGGRGQIIFSEVAPLEACK